MNDLVAWHTDWCFRWWKCIRRQSMLTWRTLYHQRLTARLMPRQERKCSEWQQSSTTPLTRPSKGCYYKSVPAIQSDYSVWCFLCLFLTFCCERFWRWWKFAGSYLLCFCSRMLHVDISYGSGSKTLWQCYMVDHAVMEICTMWEFVDWLLWFQK